MWSGIVSVETSVSQRSVETLWSLHLIKAADVLTVSGDSQTQLHLAGLSGTVRLCFLSITVYRLLCKSLLKD